MFLGHDAVGFASKRVAPRTSLGILMAAPLLLDLLWPVFLLLGIEKVVVVESPSPFLRLEFVSYPWSHSLVMSVVWGVLFGGGYWLVTRYGRGAVVIAIGVVSHWVFDWMTHRPDMPLWPGGPKVGLDLWSSPAATIAIESLLFVAGIAIYLRRTRARDRIGSVACWAFILFLAAAYLASILGPPPPSPKAIAIGALTLWLLPFWAAWFDRHREAVAD